MRFNKLALMTPGCSTAIDKREKAIRKAREQRHARICRIGMSRKSDRLADKGGQYATGYVNFWDDA